MSYFFHEQTTVVLGALYSEVINIFKELRGFCPSSLTMGELLQLPARFVLTHASPGLKKLLYDNGFLFYTLLLLSLGLPDISHRDRLLKLQFIEHAGEGQHH